MLKLHLDQRFQRFLIMSLILVFFHQRKEKIFSRGRFSSLAFAHEISLFIIFWNKTWYPLKCRSFIFLSIRVYRNYLLHFIWLILVPLGKILFNEGLNSQDNRRYAWEIDGHTLGFLQVWRRRILLTWFRLSLTNILFRVYPVLFWT